MSANRDRGPAYRTRGRQVSLQKRRRAQVLRGLNANRKKNVEKRTPEAETGQSQSQSQSRRSLGPGAGESPDDQAQAAAATNRPPPLETAAAGAAGAPDDAKERNIDRRRRGRTLGRAEVTEPQSEPLNPPTPPKPAEPRSSFFADLVAAVTNGAEAVADGGRAVIETIAAPFRTQNPVTSPQKKKKNPSAELKTSRKSRSWANRLRAAVGVKTPAMVPENPAVLKMLNAAAAKIDGSEIWAKELCLAMAGTYGFVTEIDTLYRANAKRQKPQIVATFTRPMAVDMFNWLAGTGISETPAKSFIRIKQVPSSRPFDMAKTIMARQSARRDAGVPAVPVIDMTMVALLTGNPALGGILGSLYTLVIVSTTDAYDITVDIRKDMNEAFVIATNACNKALQLNGLYNVGACYGITRNPYAVVATAPGAIVTPDMITRTTNVYRDTAVDLPDISMADFDIPDAKRVQFLELATNMATFTVIANQDLRIEALRGNERPPTFADLTAKSNSDTFAFIVNSVATKVYTNSSRALQNAATEITQQAQRLGITSSLRS